MFKNYLKIALRNIFKYRSYALINLIGLIVGLTFCMLILIFIQYEFSYDQFHEHAKDTYRVLTKFPEAGPSGSDLFRATPSSLGPALKEVFPEVVKSARLKTRTGLVSFKEKRFYNQLFYYADQEFLQIFNLPLKSGDVNTALSEPYSVILTKEAAYTLFGNENPIGQTVSFDYRVGQSHDYVIRGVFEALPKNSHLSFNYLASFSTLKDWLSIDWQNLAYVTYVELQKNINPESIKTKLTDYLSKHVGSDYSYKFELQPLTKIHLFSSFDIFDSRKADIKTIYIFTAIGFLILVVVCFNYTNLSTALSTYRTKEIGVRKIVGARKTQVFKQVWGESFFFTFIAFCFSLFLIKLLLPVFGSYVNRSLSFSLLNKVHTVIYVLGLMFFISLVSGSYPALFLTSFKPVNILKGKVSFRSKNASFFRNTLLFFQFAISIVLIICVTTMLRQMNLIENINLGYSKDNIVAIEVRDESILKNDEPFKNEIIQYPGIIDVTSSRDLPTSVGSASNPFWEEQTEGQNILTTRLYVDYDFLEFYSIECVKGRNFMRERGTDANEGFIINETAAHLMGMEEPIGKRFGFANKEGFVIGVVKDFHFESLHNTIRPLAIEINPWGHRYISIKIDPDDIMNTLDFIKNKWEELSPGFPFSYSFVDDIVHEQYVYEEKLFAAIKTSTILAILLSCIGLAGLASFSARSKIKEIGIRKVFGASIVGIITIFSKHFARVIILSAVVAWPCAYYFMHKWLQNFAYKTHIGIWIFILPTMIILFVALLTLSFQTIKAATANPVDSLKYE